MSGIRGQDGATALFPLMHQFPKNECPESLNCRSRQRDWGQVPAFSGCMNSSKLVNLRGSVCFPVKWKMMLVEYAFSVGLNYPQEGGMGEGQNIALCVCI